MTQTESAALLQEVQRYLALVDLLRAEGREPRWRTGYESERAAGLVVERAPIEKGRHR
jgi:hypothetical protein